MNIFTLYYPHCPPPNDSLCGPLLIASLFLINLLFYFYRFFVFVFWPLVIQCTLLGLHGEGIFIGPWGLISGCSTEENASSSPGTHIPFQCGVGPQESLLPLWDRMLIAPVLCRSFVGNHSYCEFPGAAAISSPEDRMPQHSSLPPGSYMLSVSTSMMFPVPWRMWYRCSI